MQFLAVFVALGCLMAFLGWLEDRDREARKPREIPETPEEKARRDAAHERAMMAAFNEDYSKWINGR